MKVIKRDVKSILKGIAIGTIAVTAFNIGKCQAQSETEILRGIAKNYITTIDSLNQLVSFQESEIREMINTIEDVVQWQQSDIEDGETRFYYLQIRSLNEMVSDLNNKLNTK